MGQLFAPFKTFFSPLRKADGQIPWLLASFFQNRRCNRTVLILYFNYLFLLLKRSFSYEMPISLFFRKANYLLGALSMGILTLMVFFPTFLGATKSHSKQIGHYLSWP